MELARVRTDVLRDRRKRLLAALATDANAPETFAIFAGLPRPKNYAANTYAYRSESHFLYLVGMHLPGAVLVCAGGQWTLYAEAQTPDDELWHGPMPSLARLGDALGALGRPLDTLSLPHAATLPCSDAASCATQASALGRAVSYGTLPTPGDVALAEAMIAVRLSHDGYAVQRMREAADAAREAHLRGMAVTEPGLREHAVRGAMEGIFLSRGMGTSYTPIVTTHGEVLHNHGYDHDMKAGDLLLADVGAETEDGWASDITRTWPVSGRFSSTQRAVYDIVLEANERGDPAHQARRALPHDLHDDRLPHPHRGPARSRHLRGDVEGLVERGAAALFFPHGLGHLLGLDVHDMEDLGDRAGYAKGRSPQHASALLPAPGSRPRARAWRHHRARLLRGARHPQGPRFTELVRQGRRSGGARALRRRARHPHRGRRGGDRHRRRGAHQGHPQAPQRRRSRRRRVSRVPPVMIDFGGSPL
jgi:Xaa-Pro aminopeptidase